jgi:ADP-ribose pyrophosphatase YjhB (NUDIX family)
MDIVISNPMRRFILGRLMTNSNLSFSELLNNEFRSSSQFNYHLSWLIKKGYVVKTNRGYKLDKKGKELVNYLSVQDVSLVKQPLLVCAVLIRSDNKIVISKSLKEPIKDLWGLSCFCKAEHGLGYKEVLSREVQTKTGLVVDDFDFRGVFSIKTVSNDRLLHHHNLHVFLCENYSGKLVRKTKHRENKLIRLSSISNYKMYPDNEFIINHVLSKKKPDFFELQRDIDKGLLKLI